MCGLAVARIRPLFRYVVSLIIGRIREKGEDARNLLPVLLTEIKICSLGVVDCKAPVSE
jgi:hypothetical protein